MMDIRLVHVSVSDSCVELLTVTSCSVHRPHGPPSRLRTAASPPDVSDYSYRESQGLLRQSDT